MEPEIYKLYYEIAFGIGRGMKQLLTGIMLAMLCRHFMVGAGARRRVWTVGAAYFAVMAVFLYIEVETYSFTAYLSAFLVAYLVLFWLEKENRQVKFLLCYVFFSMRVLAADVASELSYLLEVPAERWIFLHSGMSQENIYRAAFLSFCLFRVIEYVWMTLVLWMLSRAIVKIFFFSRNGMEKKEMLLLMLPSVLGIVYYIERERNVNVVLQKTGMYLNEMIPEYEIVEIVAQVILLAAILSMLWLYQKLKQEQGEMQSDRMVLQEVRSMRAHIEEVERLHADLRGMRHDMRNHISVLKGLMTRGELEEAQAYMNSMERSYAGISFSGAGVRTGQGSAEDVRLPEIMTGNPVTDVILAEHSRRIVEAGAVFEADFHYPDSTCVDAFDLSVILDNALTNAREAVTGRGRIRLHSFREHNAYLIVVENTFTGELSGRGAEGLPMTTKKPADEHGFGLRHMKTVVEHYHGALTIEQIGDQVRLSVMLCV